MEPTPRILIAFGATVLVSLLVVAVVAAFRRERRRLAGIRRWAAYNGWTVTNRAGDGWEVRLPGYHRRAISLVVSGTVNRWPVSVAEYWYTTETAPGSPSSFTPGGYRATSTSTKTHHLIVIAVSLNGWYPPIAVEPRGMLLKLGRTLFGDNAAATGNDAFDREFRVRTREPAAARALLGHALIAEHLAGHVPPWSLAGHDLLTWHAGRIRDPAEIPALASPLTWVGERLGR